MRKIPRIVYVITSSQSANALLRGQLQFMRENGFEVVLVAEDNSELTAVGSREGVRTIGVPFARAIDLKADFLTLIKLVRILCELDPDLVNAGTTKAGLLGMIAAAIARVPNRLYVLRGLRGENAQGVARFVLNGTERMASFFSHRVLCVSESLRQSYEKLGLAPSSKLSVIGMGSSNGVDWARFFPTAAIKNEAALLRDSLAIPKQCPVVGFVGRFTRDKGIQDLVAACKRLRGSSTNFTLLLVGEFDETDPVDGECKKTIEESPWIVRSGKLANPACAYALMDFLVLPSYREGFPNVVLESSVAGIPTIGYDATGTRDAIDHNATGLLVANADVEALTDAIRRYLGDEGTRQLHGQAAQARVRSNFLNEQIWLQLSELYRSMLRSNA
jgi:glycosyltransferase involved in cell wall biosynthesis